MIDKILENWLTNAGEREYQIPFCDALVSEGYTIIHSTNHNAMELGKDVIAQDPSGHIVAYQLKALKGGMLTLAKYREDVQPQLYDLLHGKVIHPAIPSGKPLHKAFLVVNGDLHEVVQASIHTFNQAQAERGQPELGVIVKGQLQKMFTSLIPNFAPEDPVAAHLYLQLFLSDGRSDLSVGELCRLFELCAPPQSIETTSKLKEACGSLAVICASSLSKYTQAENHVAVSNGWVAYCGYVLHLAKATATDIKTVKPYLDTAKAMVFGSLGQLVDEVSGREHQYEGDPLIDCLFTKIRTTELVSYLAVYYFYSIQSSDGIQAIPRAVCVDYVCKHLPDVLLFSEGVVVRMVPVYLMLVREGKSEEANEFLKVLIRTILNSNHPRSENGMPSSYYETGAIIPYLTGTATQGFDEDFRGGSFALEALIGLAASEGMKDFLRGAWPYITEIYFRNTEVSDTDCFRWRAEIGVNVTRAPNLTQSFAELVSTTKQRADAFKVDGLLNDPAFAIAFIRSFPHRFSAEYCAWLHSWSKSDHAIAQTV